MQATPTPCGLPGRTQPKSCCPGVGGEEGREPLTDTCGTVNQRPADTVDVCVHTSASVCGCLCASVWDICIHVVCVRVLTSCLLSRCPYEQAMCCPRLCGAKHPWCVLVHPGKLSVWGCASYVQALLGDSVRGPFSDLGAVRILLLPVSLHACVCMFVCLSAVLRWAQFT